MTYLCSTSQNNEKYSYLQRVILSLQTIKRMDAYRNMLVKTGHEKEKEKMTALK
jgi:hypothetical protein